MKKLVISFFLIFCATISFAQTKANSGKNFVTYSYDNWESAASDYLKLCKDYGLEYLYLFDDTDFSSQEFFTLKSDVWNFFIVRKVDDNGIRGSLCICSPEGRQTELQGTADGYLKSISGKTANIYSTNDPEKYVNNLKLRYSFLGENIQ